MADKTVQQPALLDNTASPAGATGSVVVPDDTSVFYKWATDPNVDVEKFERFMALWERERTRRAEALFDTAMNAAQKDIRPVVVDSRNAQTNSEYASLEALDVKVRPIYTTHGFGLSFDTGDAPHENEVRVLCYVSHSGGHKRTYRIDMPADGKGAKGGDVMTKTHATGSAVSYGQRYLLKMIFNIVTADDDGNRASGRVSTAKPVGPEPKPVDGLTFGKWWESVSEAATRGVAAFDPAWECSPPVFKNYALQTNRDGVNALKAAARAVGKA